MFGEAEKIGNYNGLPIILSEEQKWADEANEDRQSMKNTIIILLIIYAILIAIYLIKILKLIRNQQDVKEKKFNIQYFRDIPRESTSTPAEAAYLYKFNKMRLYTQEVQQDAVSATILDLCLKKKITLRTDEKSDVFIKVVGNEEGLKQDEKEIYKLLQKAGDGEEFEVEKLKKYAHDKYYEYSVKINNLVNSARNSLYQLKLIDKKAERKYSSFSNAQMKSDILVYTYFITLTTVIIFSILYGVFSIGNSFSMSILKPILILLPFVCELLYYFKLQNDARNKIAVLTEEGAKEKAEWKGLVKYMKDFSNFKEKTVPDLILWEKYLVFATALGIGDKVVEQMKAAYPEVFVKEYWEKENIGSSYPIIDFAMNPVYIYHDTFNPIGRIGGGVERAYSTSMAEIASHSSSSGGGGRRTASQAADGRSVAGRTDGMGGR